MKCTRFCNRCGVNRCILEVIHHTGIDCSCGQHGGKDSCDVPGCIRPLAYKAIVCEIHLKEFEDWYVEQALVKR